MSEHSVENDLPQGWLTIDARRFGKFDANGAVMYECPLCDYVTGPHREGGRLANEARWQHMRDKHLEQALLMFGERP